MAPPATRSTMAKAKTVLSVAASVATTAMLVRSMARDYLPSELHDYLFSGITTYLSRFTSHVTIIIEEIDGLVVNQIYDAAQTYLSGRIPPSAHLLKATLPDKDHHISVSIGRDEEIVDTFNGVKFRWVHRSDKSKSRCSVYDATSNRIAKGRFFELSFHNKHKDTAINSYLPHIVKEARSLSDRTRTLKIFTYNHQNAYHDRNAWSPVNLDHPATFETLAMDTGLKETIMSDLQRFVRRRDYYRKVGKAWKRGYLLHGPPGTGKSSLIAAMANFLNFDVYDLELTDLNRNSDLRRLLVGTANRSILVVEDIDCTIELEDRLAKARAKLPPGLTMEKKVTLSGLLNFIDGLWSSCGDERIIIFTTNHIERLDPALLRPGRMDVHVHMSYCTPCGFRILASNYLGLDQHPLFGQVEDSIGAAKVTPAEVAEHLMKSDDPRDALSDLIRFLDAKTKENENSPESSTEDKNNEGSSVEVAVDDDEDDDELYDF